ncbi:beta-galactosidase [Fusarium albosuccineum]|uniref:Beta-galactosidase n=1 Tax=Fusarium albosuccineum TaxID=1237068 RepID=A0A8H4LL23_9HYPO|nr:beta-galactosidase [Fusarium albosuccineum]
MASFYRLFCRLTAVALLIAGFSDFALSALTKQDNDTQLQDIVTWDEYSILIRGERIMFYSGEVHPFRLPSPGAWLDVFQKLRASGFAGVSFYLMWGLLEGEPGHVRMDGVFALQEFFDAASEAGVYLLARPGPYINAEVSGGGFPGWIQRIKGDIRSDNPEFLEATRTYLSHVGRIIADAQITNGGPVILVQPENEYSVCSDYTSGNVTGCLRKDYMAFVESQLRSAGITVPFISNDAVPVGNWAPGSGKGAVDIYGADHYPFSWGVGCSNPANWTRGYWLLDQLNYTIHERLSPSNPFAMVEYQGGAADFWGGDGVDACVALINHEFARVFNKLLYSMRVTVLNLYMIFGGTNWGNLGHAKGYTSYDVGAAIAENRALDREKYSELKLQGYFLQSSPSYLTSSPDNGTFGEFTDSRAVVVTQLKAEKTGYYVVRHTEHDTLASTHYSLRVPTSKGSFAIPQLGGTLSLNGRDSKIHVVDYPVGNINLVYSTAEVLTWRRFKSGTVLLVYGGEGERHEFSLPRSFGCPTARQGDHYKCRLLGSLAIVNWAVGAKRQVLHFGSGLEVYLLWRNEAYNYWILDLPEPAPLNNYTSPSRLRSTDSSVIVKAGYLVRTAKMSGMSLYLTGDANRTTEVEVIAAPATPERLYFNGKRVPTKSITHGRRELWKIQAGYDDSRWISCTNKDTNNTRALTTPTSLYASDYKFHSGSLLYRGHFTASGGESRLFISTQSGDGFGHSIWLNSTFIGSWAGQSGVASRNQTLRFPQKLKAGAPYVITVLIDHMGLHDNWLADAQEMKEPRGILDYELSGHPNQSDVSWKMTGNIGGEFYLDRSRGPLNEGSLYVERQGFHLPGAPINRWKKTALNGPTRAGVGLFATTFDLDLPRGYDIPISLSIKNSTQPSGSGYTGSPAVANFRIQIFVNGWQLGKYGKKPPPFVHSNALINVTVNNLGPQSRFVLPEGILNHHGPNYLALTLWCLDEMGAKIEGVALEADAVIQSGKKLTPLVEGIRYSERSDAY